MAAFKTGKQKREDRERLISLNNKYEQRISIAKIGKAALNNRDYATAISRFVEYMKIMADVKEVGDYFELRPTHFEPKKEITEMLMISHVFFEMARIYDGSPKFTQETQKCLSQFVSFSSNQPYQIVNSEMLRKYIKRTAFKNFDMFQNAHTQIYVESKKCYVVTFCYGDTHQVTDDFRLLKDILLDFKLGQELVRHYYLYSSVAVVKWEKCWWMKSFSKIIMRPLLLLLSKIILPVIIKKC